MPDKQRQDDAVTDMSPNEDHGTRDVDVDRPNPARMYDYYLGGAHNFKVDRDAAEKVLAMLPETRTFARDNRAFLQRAVRYLVHEAGITQFLDLGSGIPTIGNVHEIAQQADPNARVVYVDHEPVAVAQSRQLLAGNPGTAIIAADLRDTDSILNDSATRALLDFDQPIAVLILNSLPFVPDTDNPKQIVATYRDACAPGSYLALSHSLTAPYWPAAVRAAVELYSASTHPLNLRDPAEIATFFDGYQLIEPGVVLAAAWRPDQPTTPERAQQSRSVAGVGLLPKTSTTPRPLHR